MIKSAIVDSREPNWTKQLTFGNVPVAVSQLDAGDVWIATDDNCLLVIERKTPSDFLNTLSQGRLFPQCAKMKKTSPWSYIIVTGEMTNVDGQVLTDRRQTGWSWMSYQGALLTIQELGVMITWIPSDSDFEDAVVRLAKRKREDVTIRPPRIPAILGDGEAILAALPGIGPERTDALVKHCGSAAQAFHYLTDIWTNGSDAPGIGWNTKIKVRRALRLQPYEFLAVQTTGEELNDNDQS